MALRMLWLGHLLASGDDRITVYWFPEEPDWRTSYVHQALGTGVVGENVGLTATPEEIAGWTAAATACVDEVAAAVAELDRMEPQTRRSRRRSVVGRSARTKYNRVKASYLDRVRAAASAYQRVRDVIEQRIAEQQAVRVEAARREWEEQTRRQQQAEARFRAWERRQAVADHRLPGGLTPRQMAARGDNPTSWPPEVAAAVGDIASWWAGVRAAVRNEQARADAVREVIEAITATAAALEEAGRPGISTVKDKPDHKLSGWWVEFTWSGLPDVARLSTPPDMPMGHLPAGEWYYGLYLPDRVLFTPGRVPFTPPSRSGEYQFATVTFEIHPFTSSRRYWWSTRSVERFADSLFPTWITYVGPSMQNIHRFRFTDHADPAVYVPYVPAVAHCAVAVFQALISGQE